MRTSVKLLLLPALSLSVLTPACSKSGGGSKNAPNQEQKTDVSLDENSFLIGSKQFEDVDGRIKTNSGKTPLWDVAIVVNEQLKAEIKRKPIIDVLTMLRHQPLKTSDKVALRITITNEADEKDILATNVKERLSEQKNLLNIFEGECQNVGPQIYTQDLYSRDENGSAQIKVPLCDFGNTFFKPNIKINAQALSFKKRTLSYHCSLFKGDSDSWLAQASERTCTYGYTMLPGEATPDLSYPSNWAIDASSTQRPFMRHFYVEFDDFSGVKVDKADFFNFHMDIPACHTVNIHGPNNDPANNNLARIVLKRRPNNAYTPDKPYSVEFVKNIRANAAPGQLTADVLCDWYYAEGTTEVSIPTISQ